MDTKDTSLDDWRMVVAEYKKIVEKAHRQTLFRSSRASRLWGAIGAGVRS